MCSIDTRNLIEFYVRIPKIQNTFGFLPGPFISKISHDETQPMSTQVRFSDMCLMGRRSFHVRVKCPTMKCGMVKKALSNAPRLRVRSEGERKKRDEYLRIVGGDRSGPHNWPYITAIYKDGRFHCGSSM